MIILANYIIFNLIKITLYLYYISVNKNNARFYKYKIYGPILILLIYILNYIKTKYKKK